MNNAAVEHEQTKMVEQPTYPQLEEVFEPVVSEFVDKLHGTFKKHVSDKMLTSLLLEGMIDASLDYFDLQGGSVPQQDWHDQIEAIAYQAASTVFEKHLEHGCGVITNGHHNAQFFARAFKKNTETHHLAETSFPARD